MMKQQRHCFAPGCTAGYVSARKQGRKASLFAAPSDDDRRRAWERAIPRSDKPLEKNCVVCEVHFDERFIVRSYKHVIDGEKVEIPRDRPCLTSDAIPTLFPNVASYLSKKLPPKRKTTTSNGGVPTKRKKLNLAHEDERSDGHSNVTDNALVTHQVVGTRHKWFESFTEQDLPSMYWTKHRVPNAPDVVAFSVCISGDCTLWFQKLLLCSPTDTSVHCTVYVQGSMVKTVDVDNIDAVKELLTEMDSMKTCEGIGMEVSSENLQNKCRHKVYAGSFYSLKCFGVSQKGDRCLHCKYFRKLLLNQASYKRNKAKKSHVDKSRRLIAKNSQIRRQKANIAKLEERIKKMRMENESVSSTHFQKKLQGLTRKQQLQVGACFEASKRKSTNGMTFEKEWILECIVMHMKSARLYEHIRTHKVMIVPSPSCLRKYIGKYKSGFGINEKLLKAVAEKAKDVDPYYRHGGILVDEMKLSENLSVSSKGIVEGFVDLGNYTRIEDEGAICDHGLVLLFQPFTGEWQQILGVFGVRGNVKADVLSRIVVDAVICAEKCGLHVDFITCDGASWNRSMWKIFGITGKLSKTVCKVQHPVDASRFLHFISDFPHLVKCVRNSITSRGVNTPVGRVGSEYLKEALKYDSRSTVALKAMPHVTPAVCQPNGFEKQRVNLALRYFSDEVLRGLYMYRQEIESCYGAGCTEATSQFVSIMRDLISAMTSRCGRDGLRPGNEQVKSITKFLKFLDEWEASSGNVGFLSQSTAEGLRVTLASTLSLLTCVAETLKFKYLLTARLSQDPIENLFGILRQMSGSNDHPTPSQFLISVNCLSFYSLARSPATGSVSQGLLNSLLGANSNSEVKDLQDKLDELLDVGHLNEVHELVKACDALPDHKDMAQCKSDSRITYYVCGYVARKMLKKQSAQNV
ncbi:hypothetical protein HPB49_022915 [Dermacentor silvarum]|uniref:Uncharacterized protein n=1 Tax=Dermacentor silvarum TaxID=543639 RepID=A0ACB8DRQ9_DERSI|nr:hypothetical protein HPB49_022915 [Dermacentor silvarum]